MTAERCAQIAAQPERESRQTDRERGRLTGFRGAPHKRLRQATHPKCTHCIAQHSQRTPSTAQLKFTSTTAESEGGEKNRKKKSKSTTKIDGCAYVKLSVRPFEFKRLK